MRDSARIQRILNKLAAVWQSAPDLRLGQLILNLPPESSSPCDNGGTVLFYLEDEEMERNLDEWLAAHNITVSGGWKS